jgi:hypothetical protein
MPVIVCKQSNYQALCFSKRLHNGNSIALIASGFREDLMSKFRWITLLAVALVVLVLGKAVYADSLSVSAAPSLRAAASWSAADNARTMERSTLGGLSMTDTRTAGFQAAGARVKEVSSALVVVPVPEPGTSTLLICGLASLALVCRKFVRA